MTLEHEAYRLDPDADKRPVGRTFLDLMRWTTAHKAGSIDPLIMSPEFAEAMTPVFAKCHAKRHDAQEARE
jgi:hypothetical protein